MALAGLGVSIYLTVVHYQGSDLLACPNTGVVNCVKVTTSNNSYLFGTQIPITIPGMLWFIVSGAMALIALLAIWNNRREPSRLRLAHLLWGAAGMVFVLALVYAEIVQLHSLCEWCTVVHLLTLATFLIALNRWQQRGMPLPTLSPEPVRRRESAATAANGNGTRKATTITTNTAARSPQSTGNGARRSAGGARSGQRPRR
jgi:uncharacterized membrane protein